VEEEGIWAMTETKLYGDQSPPGTLNPGTDGFSAKISEFGW
jgi:hypothetical protein